MSQPEPPKDLDPGTGSKTSVVHASDTATTGVISKGHRESEIARTQSAVKIYDATDNDYKIGDFVLFNDTLYRNTTAITVAEAFDPLKWFAVDGTLNVVNVRSAADFPDAKTATITSVSDNGSNQPRFFFTTPHGYTDGQSVLIAATPATYDGFHVIKRIDDNNFDIVALTFNATVAGPVTRTLAANTQYNIGVQIITTLGYRGVDGSNYGFTSTATFANNILIAGAVTFLTVFGPSNVVIKSLNVIDVTGGAAIGVATALNIVGNGVVPQSLLVIRNSLFANFGSLGNIDETFLGAIGVGLISFNNGITGQNTSMTANNIVIANFAPNGSTGVTINNIKPNVPPVVFNLATPFVVPTNTVLDIKASNPISNTVTVTSGSGTLGGDYFKAGKSTIPSGAITQFATGGGNDVIVTSANHGLTNGETVVISGTTNYNGPFLVSSVATNTFEFNIAGGFVGDEAPATWVKQQNIGGFFNATPGNNPVTVTAVANQLVNGQQVDISGTTNYNGRFVISAVAANTFEITINGGFVAGSGGETGTWIAVRNITAVADGVTNVSSISKFSDNGKGSTRVEVADLFGIPTEGAFMVISGTTNYNGSFVVFNVVDGAPGFFDIPVPFQGDDATGAATERLILITSDGHRLAQGDTILVSGTLDAKYDRGYVIQLISGNEIAVGAVFDVTSSIGFIKDGSLDGSAKNVLVNSVSGELNSKAKGSFSMDGNIELTDLVVNVYVPLELHTVTPTPNPEIVEQSQDTELFRLSDKLTGELEYIGLEPFSGQLTATIEFANSNNKTLKFRAEKNSAIMVDRAVTTVTGQNNPTNATIIASVSAVTGDKFRLSINNTTDSTDTTIVSITTVIQ